MKINEKKTFEQFGYYSIELKPKSNKKIYAICINCGKERLISLDSYRDLCLSCVHSGENHHMFGKHHTKETKQKISKSLLGENHPQFGKKHTEEFRQKMSKNRFGENNYFFGKKHTEETKQKIRKSLSGEKHYNWKGGISSTLYCSKFNNKLRESIRERDNYTCKLCGKIQGKRKLSIHHIHYDKENCNPDLITLCASCNTKVNQCRDYWEQYFMRLLLYNNIKIKLYNMENELNIWNYGIF